VSTIGVSDFVVLTDARGNAFELRPIVCPTCGVDDTKVLGRRGGRFQRYGQGVPTTVVKCRRCTLVYANPFPFPVDPQTLYGDPDEYFSRHDEERRVARYRELVRGLIETRGVERPSVLDVGSGRGELLHAATLEGLDDVVGLEFADAMIAGARRSYGVELLPQTIEEYAEGADRTFDVVVLNAVIEHVYDPNSFIEAAGRLSRPRSVLYVDTPRDPNLTTWVGNFANRLRGDESVYNLSPTWPPYHVFGFTPRSLGVLLEKHGFSVGRVVVHANPRIPARGEWRDRTKSFAATQLRRVANRTATASNMSLWARRSPG
jgi:SAM-dependent methyltransferase